MIPIPTMTPTLPSDMYVEAFHCDQESTLQGVYVAGRTSAARVVDDNISGPSVFSLAVALGYLCDCNPVQACGKQLIVGVRQHG
jgi:hypothetical protein